MLRFFNRNSTYKHRLTFCMSFLYLLADCLPLVFLIKVNLVIFINTGNRTVCRNGNNVKIINLVELNCFRSGSTGHTGKLVVHTEEILERNRSKGSVALCNSKMFLCFNCLMKSVTVTASFKHASGKFIYNLNLSVTDKIIYVCLIKFVGTHCLRKVMHELKILFVNDSRSGRNKVVLVENFINLIDTGIRKGNAL